MFLEIAHLEIKSGEEAAFERNVALAVPYWWQAVCRNVTVGRSRRCCRRWTLLSAWMN